MTGQELKRLRRRLRLTQRELGKLVGVHLVSVSRWETGTHKVPTAVAKLVSLLKTKRKKKKGGK